MVDEGILEDAVVLAAKIFGFSFVFSIPELAVFLLAPGTLWVWVAYLGMAFTGVTVFAYFLLSEFEDSIGALRTRIEKKPKEDTS